MEQPTWFQGPVSHLTGVCSFENCLSDQDTGPDNRTFSKQKVSRKSPQKKGPGDLNFIKACREDSLLERPVLGTTLSIFTGKKGCGCPACGRAFGSKPFLTTRRVHTRERTPACSQRASLIQHQRVNTGEKPYHCNACGEAFGDQSFSSQYGGSTQGRNLTDAVNVERRLAGPHPSVSIRELI